MRKRTKKKLVRLDDDMEWGKRRINYILDKFEVLEKYLRVEHVYGKSAYRKIRKGEELKNDRGDDSGKYEGDSNGEEL